MLDEHLTMSNQVSAIVGSCNFHLRIIGKAREFLSETSCRDAVAALVTFRLDYCGSLLAGTSQHNFDRLQRVQNRAAGIITRTPMLQHITPVLYRLHWLHVKQRIMFRLLVFVFRCIQGTVPSYVSNLIEVRVPPRQLRSSTFVQLLPRRSYRKSGEQVFQSIAPSLWNALPPDIRDSSSIESFRRRLKTYLFRQFY